MEEWIYQFVPFLLGLISVYVAYKYFTTPGPKTETEDSVEHVKEEVDPDEKNAPKAAATKAKKLQVSKKDVKDSYAHPWLHTNLKGHGSEIFDMAFSSNGKYLASSSNDRAVMLWTVKSFNEKNHKSVRANMEFDYATHIEWSPDSKAFIVSAATANTVQVYRVGRKSDGSLGNIELILTFPEAHASEIINIGIACNGHFIMSCSSDTSMIIWDLKGEKLTTIDTLHINNYYACVSPCGRFVASSGFTPDVRVWEVCFSKTGEFREVKRAFELKGHTSGIYHFSFSNDSSRMLTVSKDGSWKLWDTNIEYLKGQEPYLLLTSAHSFQAKCFSALSPDGRTVAIASNTAPEVFVYSGVNGELQAHLTDVNTAPMKCLAFSPDGQFLLAATGRLVRVFHSVPGYQNAILDLKKAKEGAKSASTKERLDRQIEEARSALKKIIKT